MFWKQKNTKSYIRIQKQKNELNTNIYVSKENVSFKKPVKFFIKNFSTFYSFIRLFKNRKSQYQIFFLWKSFLNYKIIIYIYIYINYWR